MNQTRSSSQPPADPMTASHAAMIVAATLTAAIAANCPSSFRTPTELYNEYVRIFQRVRLDDVNPTFFLAGTSL